MMSPTASQYLILLLAIVVIVYHPAANAADDDKHSCACEAEEFNFAINCDIGEGGANRQNLTDAVAVLRANNCQDDCSSDLCLRNWLIVQSHHDYCPEDVIPQEVEDDFHDYDTVCETCAITRQATEGAEDCPTVTCDGAGNTAYDALSDSDPSCFTDCSPASCKENYLILKTVHDTCDHDTLSVAAEQGLHDWEEPCKMHVCNIPGATDKQLVCDDHDDHDHHDHDDHGDEDGEAHSDDKVDEEPSGAASLSVVTAGLVLGAAALV